MTALYYVLAMVIIVLIMVAAALGAELVGPAPGQVGGVRCGPSRIAHSRLRIIGAPPC